MSGTLRPPVGTVMYMVLNISKVMPMQCRREIWPTLLALTAMLANLTFSLPLVMFAPNLLVGVAK